jgi:hypothetical protein
MNRTIVTALSAAATALALGAAAARPASAGTLPDWPDLYDPFALPVLYLELTEADWNTIRFDLSFDIEVPADFWADGEDPILVSVRRKSSVGLPSEADPVKVGLKIDINEYVSSQVWHGVKKLSLENGGDGNVITEGFAWMLHRRAAHIPEYGYTPGLGHWVELHVRLSDDDPDGGDVAVGVYADVEQPEKQFMVNRGLFVDGFSWMYEIDDIGGWALEVGDPHSPAFEALCYLPFEAASCPTPDEATVAADVEQYVNVEAMFAQGATDAFIVSPDALFSHSKNFLYMDFAEPVEGAAVPRRLYIPWDLDAVFQGLDEERSIYDVAGNNGDEYEELILDNTLLRPVHDEVFCNLLAGPFQEPGLIQDLDDIEAAIATALAADPNHNLGGDTPGEVFDGLRNFVAQRIANVTTQLPPCSAIFRDGVERGDTVNWSATVP